METFGGLDIIVNNAGYTWDATIQKMTDEQFQAMLDVHLIAPFRILRAAAEPIRMLAKKDAEAGREVFRKVVNISSIAGLYGNAGPGQLFVRQGRADRHDQDDGQGMGTLQGQRQLRRLRPHQDPADSGDRGAAGDDRRAGREIKVGVQPHLLATFERRCRLGRGGTPEEAADAVYLFCIPESNYVSGQIVAVGGGLLM